MAKINFEFETEVSNKTHIDGDKVERDYNGVKVVTLSLDGHAEPLKIQDKKEGKFFMTFGDFLK